MASRSVNQVILLGSLGRDAETSFLASGVAVTKFSVATNKRWKDKVTDEWKESVTWTNVVLWRNENLGQYLTKGKQVYIQGSLETKSYEDKDGKKVYATNVVADEVILLGGKGGEQEAEAPMKSSPRPAAVPASSGGGLNFGLDDESDVPF